MSATSAWLILFIAGLCEIGGPAAVKPPEPPPRPCPSVPRLPAGGAGVALLGWALKVLPLGTAYAVWTGIGAVGTALLGIYLFNESRDVLRLLCIGLIVAGIVGLKLLSDSTH